MTRVNLIPVEELHPKHLQGEYKEIVRIFCLARKAQWDVMKGKVDIPKRVCPRYWALQVSIQ